MHKRRTGALILGITGIASFLVLASGLYATGIVIDANQLDPQGAFVGPIILAVIALVVGIGGLISWIVFTKEDVARAG